MPLKPSTVILLSVSLALASIGCEGGGSSPKKSSSSSSTYSSKPPKSNIKPQKEWYAGGTLHKKTMADWKKGSYRDRLATCADFVVAIKKYKTIPNSLKSEAAELEKCLSESVEGHTKGDSQIVSDSAAMCAVLMKW